MLILIPIYNRTSILKWVLKSVQNSSLENELIKVCVINNHFKTKDIVNEVLSEFENDDKFKWIVIHREVSITHVKSWYSALFDHAEEGEVVTMLGDDDFMLPFSSFLKYNTIIQNEADMLLTSFVDRLYFFKNNTTYWLNSSSFFEDISENTIEQWDFIPGKEPEASFISNHTYRFTENFRNGLNLAFNWCEEQNWLCETIRMGMLPLYLPFAISLSGGKVICLNKKCVIRGAIVPDVFIEEYAGGGSTQLFLLCAYDTFSNTSIKNYSLKLKIAEEFYEPLAKTFDPDLLWMKNVNFKSIKKLYKHAKIKPIYLINRKSLNFIVKYFIKRVFFLSGLRLRIINRTKNLEHINQIFEKQLNPKNYKQ
jgi:hypothetical protein